jgi:hypothetical protein
LLANRPVSDQYQARHAAAAASAQHAVRTAIRDRQLLLGAESAIDDGVDI